MYIVMNRFDVSPDNSEAFEEMWLNRDSFLKDMDGFVAFHMLKGPEKDGSILYASHTTWETQDHFLAWTRSQAFRDAHKNAGGASKLHNGHPNLETFASIQSIEA